MIRSRCELHCLKITPNSCLIWLAFEFAHSLTIVPIRYFSTLLIPDTCWDSWSGVWNTCQKNHAVCLGSLPCAVISSKLHWIEHANIFEVQSFGCLQLFLFSSCSSDPKPWGCKIEKSKDTWWKRWRKEEIPFRKNWIQDELYKKSGIPSREQASPSQRWKNSQTH